jgi:hypothetical protein
MGFFVPSFSLAGEAEPPVNWAAFPAIVDAELCSHGAFSLAGIAGQGGRVCRPLVQPGFAHNDGALLDAGDNRLDCSELASLLSGEEVRMALVDVLLVAALPFQLRHERDRLIGRARTVLRHDVDQRALDVLRHSLGVAADIHMRAVGEP